MWKRVLVVIIALVGTFSVVYVANGDMFANTTTYNSGGNVTGRVNKAPSGISGSHIGLQKGDKILMGTKTLENEDLGWQLIKYVNDPTYSYIDPLTGSSVVNGVTGWLSASTVPIKRNVKVFDGSTRNSRLVKDTNLQPFLNQMNTKINSNAIDKSLLQPHYKKSAYEGYHNILSVSSNPTIERCSVNNLGFIICYGLTNLAEQTGNVVFIPSGSSTYGYLTLDSNNWTTTVLDDTALKDWPTDYQYWNTSYGSSAVNTNTWLYNTTINEVKAGEGILGTATLPAAKDIRVASYLNTTNVVFAISKGSSDSFAKVTQSNIKDYTYLKADTDRFQNMKLRLENSAMTSSTEFNQINNINRNKITKAAKDSTVYLNATAVNGSDSVGGVYTISALVFDESGNFVYYKPLAEALGTRDYAFDTTGLPVGKYKIAIVNEAYNENSNTPAQSSAIKGTQSLEIVPAISLNVSNTPQSGASEANTFEYSKNVSKGDQVASIQISGGVDPMSLTLQPSTTNASDYEKFEIGKDASGNNIVKVKKVEGLDAGTYSFFVKATDANNNNQSKEVSIVVQKTIPTLEFDNTTENPLLQKDLLLGGAQEIGKIKTSNTDLNLSSVYKPTYTLSGKSNVLSMGGITDIKSYTINIAATIPVDKTLPDTYTLSVDLPETSNFQKPLLPISRTYYVYKTLSDLKYTGVTTLSTTNAMASYSIGTLSAVDGVGKYTYTKTDKDIDGVNHDAIKGKDNDKINVNKDTGSIELNQKLDAGTYYFKCKATDAKGGTSYKTIELTVSAINQSQFAFKNVVNGAPIDKLSIPYEANNKTIDLILEGGSGNGAVTCKIDDGQQMNVIDINMVNGKCVATIKNASSQAVRVIASKEADGHYNKATATVDITITEAEQTVTFDESTLKIKNKLISSGDFNIVASANGRTDLTTSSTIKYSSKDTAICMVTETTGIVTPKAKGTCALTAVNEDANYKRAEAMISIALYDNLDPIFKQTTNPVAIGTTAVKVAEIQTTGGDGSYLYEFKPASSLLTIDTSGNIKLSKTLSTADLTGKWDADKNKYIIHEKVTVSDKSGNSKEVDVDIECEGKTLNASFVGAPNKILHVPFTSVGDSFKLSLKDNLGGGDVTYSLASGSVLQSITASGEDAGTSYIERASDGDDDFAEVKAVIAPKNGYLGQEINVKIYIDKATQSVNFESTTPTSYKYVNGETFTVKATAKSGATILGSKISYQSSTPDKCTISGDEVTMKAPGDCKLTASATLANYSDATSNEHKITFFDGVDAQFEQTANNLQAKQNNATIPDTQLPVGVITKEGGLGTITYEISSNVGDLNKAGTMFKVDESGNVSLIHDLKASDLVMYGVYDSTNNTYLLNFQVDVLDNGVVSITKDFTVKMQGASLSLSFTDASNGTITKTYSPLGYFDLAIQGNLTSANPTYSYKSGQTLSTSDIEDIIKLNGKKITIQNADTRTPIITAEVPASDGYAKTQVDVNIKIDKAEQTNFAFTETNETITLELNSKLTINFTSNESGEDVAITSDDESLITVDTDGKTIIASSTNMGGPVTISATAPGNRNYIEKTLTKQVVVFGSLSGQFKQTFIPQVGENAIMNKTVGSFSVTGGLDPVENVNVTWADETLSSLLKLVGTSTPGVYDIKLKKAITIDDIKTLYDATSKKYLIPASIKMSDSSGEATIPATIEITGAQVSDIAFTDAVDGKITREYEEGGAFPLSLVDDTFKNVTFTLKEGSATDVVTPGIEDSQYMLYIENATQAGDPTVELIATIPAQNGYTSGTMSCVVEITQAQQNFNFVAGDINFKKGTSVTPRFTSVPKGNGGKVILESDKEDIIKVVGTTLSGIGEGTSTITAIASGNRNYAEKVVSKDATVYEDMSLSFTQNTTLPQAGTQSGNAGASVGTYTTSGGLAPVTVALDTTLVDNAFFSIANTGVLSIGKNITASDLALKPWNEEKQAYEMQVTFKITDATNKVVKETKTVYVKGASIQNVAFEGSDGLATTKIEKVYEKDGSFMLSLTGKADNVWPFGQVVYSLKEGTNTTEVVSGIDQNGTVHILNANLLDNEEKVMAVATIAPGNGYEGKTLECEIYITKATQPFFAFGGAQKIKVDIGRTIQPNFVGLLSAEEVTITIENQEIASYDHVSKAIQGLKAGTTTIHATTSDSDRNYAVATAQGNVLVSSASEYVLQIGVPLPVTYGDESAQATIKTNGAIGSQKVQKWFSSDENVATIDDTGKITIHHAGSTLIHVEQTTELETETVVSPSMMFTVKPKPITVMISDKEKYVGQDLPLFTLEPIDGLVGSDAITEPIYGCQDSNGDYVDAYTEVGSYDIDGYFNTNANPDYKITLEKGTLTIKQDPSKPSWYQVVSDTQPTERGWYNKPVTLKLIQEDSYDKISDYIKGPWDETIIVDEEGILDKNVYFKDTITSAIAEPQEQTIKVDETAPQVTRITENETNRSSTAKFLNIVTFNQFFKPGSEITIQAEDVLPNTDVAVSDIAKIDYKIYKDTPDATGNTLVKEGSETANKAIVTMSEVGDYKVCAIATDNAGNASKEVCQSAEVKKIDIDVDGDGKLDFNDSNNDGCPDLNIKWKDKDGETWIIMNGDRDYDGIPDLNIDSDGDGEADLNIDTNHDGIPDINLVVLSKKDWTTESMSHCVISQPEEYCTGTSVKAVINVDTDGDLIPNHDIDTDGDMKPNLNIKSTEGILLNRIPMKTWNPEVTFDYEGFAYATMKDTKAFTDIDSDNDGRPDINIDFDNDGIPDLNIDSNDDGIPDLNIDGDGDGNPDYNLDVDDNGKPTKNVITIEKWEPNQDGIYKDKKFDTVLIEKRDQLEDNKVIVKPSDPNHPFLANYALRVSDVTKDLEESLQDKIELKEGRMFYRIYRLELLRDGAQVQPDGKLKIQIPIPEDIVNPILYMEQKDGTYQSISYVEEDGYYVIETDYLGVISIVGDDPSNEPTPPIEEPEQPDTPKDPVTPEQPKPDTPDVETPKSDIPSTETPTTPNVPDNAGGAMISGTATGDTTNLCAILVLISASFLILRKSYRKIHH